MHALVVPLFLGALTLVFYFLNPRRRPLGPQPLPFIGNLLQMPKDHEWKTFAEWAKNYGDCVYFHVFGQPIVILDSLTAAHDLLDQRSAIYSSRPSLVMAGELTGFSQGIGLMPYSPHFLRLRRLIHKELTSNMLQKYWPLHEDESRILIKKILADPSLFLDSIRHYSGSVILRATYGYQTAPRNDKFLVLAEEVMAAFSLASQPGAWVVDFLPWHCSYVGQNTILFSRTRDVDTPLLVQPNFVSTILSQSPDALAEDDRDLLLWASSSLFGGMAYFLKIMNAPDFIPGGADTTVAVLSTFFLAMALYPEVQAKAQAELDKVVLSGRLPQLSDRPSLPYIECLMREVLRWKSIAPLGLPHLLTKDDIYKDYHLPKGSIVMVNVWSILRDPTIFPDPHEFRPERFINDQRALDSVAAIFGFRRRACPGVHFAEASMFIAIATALSQCNISDPVDSRGEQLRNDVEYQTGTISHPEKFHCNITPRVKLSAE